MTTVLPGIRPRRIAAGLSLETLGARLGVTRQCVSRWETGAAVPSAGDLPQIAGALGCSIEDLYTEIINQEENESHDLQ